MNRSRAAFVAAALIGLVLAFRPVHGAPAGTPPTPHGPDVTAMDRSVPPSQDFYLFANGGWLKSHTIPGDRPRWGRFDELREKSSQVLRTLVERAASGQAPLGSNERKVGDFFASGMDVAGIEKAGLAPLRPELDAIDRLQDARGLTEELARLHRLCLGVAFDLSSEQDMKDSTKVIGVLSQSGLGLPDRDYYFKDDEKSKKIRAEYQAHVARMLVLAGVEPAQARTASERIVAFETRLAKASLTRVERRDPNNSYHMTSMAALAVLAPHIAWDQYFRLVGTPRMASINVAPPGLPRRGGSHGARGAHCRVEGLPALARPQWVLPLPSRALRAGILCLQRRDHDRGQGDEAPLEARAGFH